MEEEEEEDPIPKSRCLESTGNLGTPQAVRAYRRVTRLGAVPEDRHHPLREFYLEEEER